MIKGTWGAGTGWGQGGSVGYYFRSQKTKAVLYNEKIKFSYRKANKNNGQKTKAILYNEKRNTLASWPCIHAFPPCIPTMHSKGFPDRAHSLLYHGNDGLKTNKNIENLNWGGEPAS